MLSPHPSSALLAPVLLAPSVQGLALEAVQKP